jgi:hypothetical protein
MSHDDQDWLDALAGRAAAARDSAGAAEGELLRRGMLASRRVSGPDMSSAASADLGREVALISRASSEGLIPAAVSPRRSARATWQPLLAAAALGAFAFGIAWQFRDSQDRAIVRDAQAEPVRLEASRPRELQQRIVTELRAAGVAATGYESLGVHGIDADLPQPVPTEVQRVLRSHGVPPPTDGVLRIEIRESR